MKQYIKALIEKATDTGFSFLASTAAVDRQGDSIDQAGWDLGNYMKNPVMLWAHDYSSLPVARAESITVDPMKGLVGTAVFAPAEGNPFAEQLKVMVQEGFVSALSVGFIPKERNGNIITKSELLEISFVPVPANQEALMLAAKSLKSKGFAEEAVDKFLTEIREANAEIAAAGDAPAPEAKGPVSDEIDAEEAMEQKWAKMDEFFEVVGAVCDVYFDEETPVEAFASIMLEASGLIAQLAQTDGADDDDEGGEGEAVQMAAFGKLLRKSVEGIDAKKALATLVEKIGARHSAATKEALQKAKDHIDAASAMLGGMMDESASPSTEDGDGSGDDEPTDDKAVEQISGKDAARALLEVRGVLRERAAGDNSALSIINRHLAGRA